MLENMLDNIPENTEFLTDEILQLDVGPDYAGERADKFLSSSLPDYTRSALQKFLEQKRVSCNGRYISKNYRVDAGDCILIAIPEPESLDMEPENIPLDIIYEDNDLLVVNKPKGMVVHPAPGHYHGTLVNALLYHCGSSLSGINGVLRPGIVHRIDKDTSGLLIVAKNDQSHRGLADQIQAHSFTRKYEAVAYGSFKEDSGTVNAPIGRHPTDRKKMCINEKNGRPAVTHYTVLNRYPGFTHLSLQLETGRTHQIRVHMASLGHPIAGDPVYGVKKVITELNGQCLHARVIGFQHPVSGEYLEFESELPDYFMSFLNKLERL